MMVDHRRQLPDFRTLRRTWATSDRGKRGPSGQTRQSNTAAGRRRPTRDAVPAVAFDGGRGWPAIVRSSTPTNR